ncbi:MAG: sulfatase [Bacteroidota bacterium]
MNTFMRILRKVSPQLSLPFLVIFCALIFTFLPIRTYSQASPNIVLFLADDMAWFDAGAYGSEQAITPNIDKLASEGMRFDNMFTSTAMCAPTRQQLYTGLWPVRNGAYPNHSWVYNSVKSIPHYFGAQGYRTALAGKDHFGPPEAFPFERLSTKLSTDSTFERIEEFVKRDSNQPFFLVVTSNEPHVPWNRGNVELFPSNELTIPSYLVDCRETRKEMTKYLAEINAMDEELGKCMDIIGQSSKLKENTLFIFTSEQGSQFPFGKWTCYDHGLKTAFIVRWPRKVAPGSSNDALTQYIDVVPTLLEAAGIDWKNVQTGAVDEYGNANFDGESFMDVLTGVSSTHRKYVFGIHTTRGILDGSESYPIRSIRSDKYLYIRNLSFGSAFRNVTLVRNSERLIEPWRQIGQTDEQVMARTTFYEYRPYEELYDVVRDPNHLHNLAMEETYTHIKKPLGANLSEWMKQQGDWGVATEMEAKFRQKAYLIRNPNANHKGYQPPRPNNKE